MRHPFPLTAQGDTVKITTAGEGRDPRSTRDSIVAASRSSATTPPSSGVTPFVKPLSTLFVFGLRRLDDAAGARSFPSLITVGPSATSPLPDAKRRVLAVPRSMATSGLPLGL